MAQTEKRGRTYRACYCDPSDADTPFEGAIDLYGARAKEGTGPSSNARVISGIHRVSRPLPLPPVARVVEEVEPKKVLNS
jgi:hypothetical protein